MKQVSVNKVSHSKTFLSHNVILHSSSRRTLKFTFNQTLISRFPHSVSSRWTEHSTNRKKPLYKGLWGRCCQQQPVRAKTESWLYAFGQILYQNFRGLYPIIRLVWISAKYLLIIPIIAVVDVGASLGWFSVLLKMWLELVIEIILVIVIVNYPTLVATPSPSLPQGCLHHIQGWNCRGLGVTHQFISTDAHFWVKIGHKLQSLGKISNISAAEPPPPVLLGQYRQLNSNTDRIDDGANEGKGKGQGWSCSRVLGGIDSDVDSQQYRERRVECKRLNTALRSSWKLYESASVCFSIGHESIPVYVHAVLLSTDGGWLAGWLDGCLR